MTQLAAVLAASLVLFVPVGGAVSLVLDPVVKQGHDPWIEEAEEKLQMAFVDLNAVDEIGAPETEVSALAEKLNIALNLLRDARALEADDNNSGAAEYASQSVVISDSVREEAEELRETTSGELLLRRVLAFGLAPVVGFITSLVFYLAYRAWRRPSMEEVLRMGIRRKEKRG